MRQPTDDMAFLTDGGKVGALMREHDWAATALSAPETWSQSLRTTISLLLASRHGMMLAWGPELTLFYNDAYAPFLGQKHPWALGRPFKEVWSDIWTDIEPLVEKALAGEAVWFQDFHLVMQRNGYPEDTWWQFSYSPVRDDTGRIAGMLNVTSEMTAKVLVERRLAFRIAFNEHLLHLSDPDEIMSAAAALIAKHLGLDRVGYTEIIDNTTVRMTRSYVANGMAPLTGEFPLESFGAARVARQRQGITEVCGDVWADPDQDNEVWNAIDTRALISVPLVREGQFRASLYVNNRNPRRWTPEEVALIEDIAARTWDAVVRARSEAALRELNRTLEQRVAERTRELERVWHHSQDLQVVVDGDGIFQAVSPAATRLLGWSPEEMIGRPLFEFTHPDGHVKRTEKLAGALAGPTETHLNRYRDKAGNYHWISWITTPADGLIYCSGREVTVEIERQAELEAAQEQLRQAQKMDAMGQLTGGVAHDFNNLLTPIIGSLDRLLTRGVGSERERRLMDGALQSAERAKVLVQRLLAFARKQPLQPGPVEIRPLVSEMAELIASTVGPRIDVRVDMPEDLPPALADTNQLEMALLNLAVNARDAMPEAGVLSISAEHVTVRTGRRTKLRPGSYVRLSVNDTGIGMDEVTLARAVEPFFSTKGVGKGTGLGLSMVHGLALQLGGTLMIDSRLGEGTTINLWLPVSMMALGESGQTVQTTLSSKEQGTALLVDDENFVRLSTADMLMDLGYEVVEASSAEEALRLIGEGLHPDLVVTDHLMPGMTGLDLARDLRARRPDLPVLIISGYAEMDGIAPNLPRLTKPFRAKELAGKLVDMLPPE